MWLIEKIQLIFGLVWFFLLCFSAMAQPGLPDSSFGNAGRVIADIGATGERANDVAIQPDGKIVVVGESYDVNGSGHSAVLRYNPNGTLDTTFNGDGKVVKSLGNNVFTYDVVIQPNGKIIVGGYYSNPVTTPFNFFNLQRFNPDGSDDTGFGTL
jgi:uncharacterized delta-60 repeat protein